MLGNKKLKALRHSALAVAAGLAVASSSVYAQSNATGTVYGTVSSALGNAVVVENVSTGAKRTITPDASGHYQVTALPPGNYKVSLMKGNTVVSSRDIEVLIGQGAEATFAGSQLETVQVTGTRKLIDNTATNSVSTFTAKQLANLPIGQDLTSIILLAPDTVKADPRYAGGASIGGGAPSENSYYIDGFPVTNALSQLGSIELPFGAISQANVLTGGFGAEFGRSTGGVMNIVTKSGGNKWEGGGYVSVEPDALRSPYSNIYYAKTGVINNKTGLPFDGTLNTYNAADTKTEYKYGGYVGGPLIQDKLFMFVAVDQAKDKESGVNGTSTSTTLPLNGWDTSTTTNNRWLAKLDWQINEDHRLTLMNFGDNYTTNANFYSFNYGTLQAGSTVNYSGHYINQPNVSPAVGGFATLARYTGNLTENLVLTAVLGEAKSSHVQSYSNFASGINLNVPGAVISGSGAAPGLTYNNPNPLTALDLPTGFAQDTTKSGRLDLEWSLGSHTLRAGYDKVKLSSSNAGQVEAGGGTWSYRKTGNPTGVLPAGPYTFTVSDGVAGSLASQGYYVRKHVFSDVTNATSDQDAEYIEDKWQVTKQLFLQAGLRNEGFSGANGEGATYLKSKNFISPRLAGAYDVYGDAGLTLKGSIGRYSIQTPTHLAVRGAGVSTLTYQYYRYTGVDANGQPTGLTALTPAPYSPDGETGQPKDATTYAAHDLKPSYQDEVRLGFDKALSPTLVAGFMATYRRLGATLDDYCGTAFDKYADAHGINRTAYDSIGGGGGCYLINPGRNNTFLVDYAVTRSNYTTVTLTPADIGFPEKPKRTFLALDFSLEHPFSNGWYGKVTYTWSQNKGNTEGQTKSDIGQTDVSATETWDFPQLMEGANGYLPNDRTHQIHVFGYYQVNPELTLGGNLTAQSGRPKNCFGNYGGTNPDGDPGYGSAFFYCNLNGTVVATPRASQGRLPWDVNLDVNANYRPAQVKGLSLRVDVFNLFNRQTVQAINEVHENDGDPTSLLSSYGMPISYSAPRAVKFTATYEF